MPTASCNFVVLLGTVGPAGVWHGFSPHCGQLALFQLVVGETAIPCKLTGSLAGLCFPLPPGAMVIVHGVLDMRDEELGEDTGRLVVVGTALTVVQQGEVRETPQKPVPIEVLERGLARFAADGRRGGRR